MPHTLRRKMFKLGGEVNTHGVGITSGLNYNRPGYNGGGPIVKPGPDGKPRQHAFWGGVANFALAGIPNALRYLTNPLVRRFGIKGAKEIADEAKKVGATKIGGMGTTMLGGNIAQAMMLAQRAAQKGYKPMSKWAKAYTLGLPAVYGLGAGTALGERAGRIDPERTTPVSYTNLTLPTTPYV